MRVLYNLSMTVMFSNSLIGHLGYQRPLTIDSESTVYALTHSYISV